MEPQDNEEEAPEVLHLVLSKLNSLITLLQAIKVGAKQVSMEQDLQIAAVRFMYASRCTALFNFW
jgi:hypothetical protein